MPEIIPILDKCIPDIFHTMANLDLTCGQGDDDSPRPSVLTGVTGSVCLSGKANGVVYTAFPIPLAEVVAKNVLGTSDLNDGDVSDVIGEFTNMITGNLKSQLCDLGYPCQLSIPTVMRGVDISVVAKNAPICVRNTYSFPSLSTELVVVVFAKFD
jgi:chemotaxis protein CheX